MKKTIATLAALFSLNCGGSQIHVDWPEGGCDLRYRNMIFSCDREEYNLSGSPYHTEGGEQTILRGYRPLQRFYYIHGRMHVIEENPEGGLNVLLRTQHGPVMIQIDEEGDVESARLRGF